MKPLKTGWKVCIKQAKVSIRLRRRRAIERFLHWHDLAYEGLAFELAKILPRDICSWKAQQQKIEKASPASINQRLTAMRQFFDWAQNEELIDGNPADGISPLRLGRNKPQAIKPNLLRRLLRVAQGDSRDYAMLEFLLGTGLRVQELLNLKVGDLELHERWGKVIVRYAKGSQYREIPLTLDCRQALQAYLQTGHPEPQNRDSPLWFGKKGALSHRSSVLRMLQNMGRGLASSTCIRINCATLSPVVISPLIQMTCVVWRDCWA